MMTIVDTDKLNAKYKCIFCTMLTEKASEYITDLRGWLLLKNGITKCWEWIETGRYCGDDIYGVVEENECLTGFLYYAIEAEDLNDKSGGAWCSIVEAIMYIARKVYEKDGYTSFPEPVEEVEEDMIQLAIERLSETADVQDYTDEIYDLCLKETAIADIQHRFALYQMKFDFTKLNEKYKCVFLLTLAEKAVSCIENEAERDYAKCALEACWEWVDTGKHSGATLIEFIGDDDSGLYYYEFTEREPIVTTALNFVVTAVSFVARIAFENEGVRDMPKFAAVTTDAVIPYVLDRFTMCYKDTNAYISDVYKLALTEKNGLIAYNEAITEVQKNQIKAALEFVKDTADVDEYINELYHLCLKETDITHIKPC